MVDGAWSTTWDTTTVPDGTYFVQVRAVDLAGNLGDPGEVFLEVDNQGPVVEPAPRSTDPTNPHAIGEVDLPGGTDTYTYDASGSQTQRTEGGVTYNQTMNGEGRLIGVQNTTSGETWTFTYDGDGDRIRQVSPDRTSTLFLVGGLYEITLDAAGQQTAVKRYYAVAGQTIALRDGSGTFYLLADHLGSVVAVLDGSGTVVGEQRYRPFGQPRLTPGIVQTDRGYTGQRNLAAAGLQDFNARWFGTSLGMFASPDSLVPDPFDPQGLSRYSYVFSNPVRYADPSGHRPCEYDQESCRPAPAPATLRGTTVHGGQTLAGAGMGSYVVTQAFEILNEDRQSQASLGTTDLTGTLAEDILNFVIPSIGFGEEEKHRLVPAFSILEPPSVEFGWLSKPGFGIPSDSGLRVTNSMVRTVNGPVSIMSWYGESTWGARIETQRAGFLSNGSQISASYFATGQFQLTGLDTTLHMGVGVNLDLSGPPGTGYSSADVGLYLDERPARAAGELLAVLLVVGAPQSLPEINRLLWRGAGAGGW